MTRRVSPLLILAGAVLAVAHGAIFVRLASEAQPLAIAAWRVTLATAIVVPIVLATQRAAFSGITTRDLLLTIGAGGLLAAHFASWISSLQYTSISNSVLLVSTAPVWVAVIGRITGTVKLSRLMTLAIVISLVGSAIIASGSAAIGRATLRGDLLALVGAVCMGAYLLTAQRVQRNLRFGTYVVLAYASTAVWLWIAALASGTPMTGFASRTWWALGGIAVVSQVIGHSGYNFSLRQLKPEFVAVTLLGEPIVASILGLALFHEPIPALTACGGALVLAAILLAAKAQKSA
ncbi:MAG TPA: DMT family transporter [Steroidobacteraceae bacterium]|nr:DMT family transporter [Steroidobacteraceae bacterium]